LHLRHAHSSLSRKFGVYGFKPLDSLGYDNIILNFFRFVSKSYLECI